MKSHCNTCGGNKTHSVIAKHEKTDSEPYNDECVVDFGVVVQVLQCGGCGDFSFSIDKWNSECIDENGVPESSVEIYPPRIFRKMPQWLEVCFLTDSPTEIDELMKEAYICLQNSCPRAAAMSIRAVLERMMINKVGDNKSFVGNLDAFEKAGYLSAKQREIIEPVLEAGHASIHRGFKPSHSDLVLIFDITETLFEMVYVHKSGADYLSTKIPKKK